MSILFCVFIKELEQTVKTYNMTIMLNFGEQKFIVVSTLPLSQIGLSCFHKKTSRVL